MFRSLNILHKGKLDTSHLCFEYMTLTLEKSALALVVQDGGVISHAQGVFHSRYSQALMDSTQFGLHAKGRRNCYLIVYDLVRKCLPALCF